MTDTMNAATGRLAKLFDGNLLVTRYGRYGVTYVRIFDMRAFGDPVKRWLTAVYDGNRPEVAFEVEDFDFLKFSAALVAMVGEVA